MKIILSWTAGIIAFVLYAPLLIGIFKNQIKQSFATWMLWVLLDVIALGSIIAQKGDNWTLLACYISGGTIVAVLLIYKKQFRWTWIESATVSLVFICIFLWLASGPKLATIASTLAVCLSGIPQYVESRKEPDVNTGWIYLGYTLVNFLSFLAGKEWTIADRFYYGMTTLLCVSIAYVALQKKSVTTPL